MANQGGGLPNHHPAPAVQHIRHDNVPAGHGDRRHQHYPLLDAARALMLLGAVAAVSTVGNTQADAARVFFGFAAWLLGVCLLAFMLVLVAGRFPQADALVGAAIAITRVVLRHLFSPWNASLLLPTL